MLARLSRKTFLRTSYLPLSFNVRGFAARRLRDENAPERPLSGYSLFMKARAPEVRKQSFGNLRPQAAFRNCADEWSAMSPEQKQSWNAQVTGKEEYAKQMVKYRQSDEYAEFKKKKALADKREKLKELNLPAPKRPLSA